MEPPCATGFFLAMTLGEIVATNIRRIRQERNLTQEALADLVGINRNYVGMLERQENSPTVAMLERLATALEIDPIEFFQSHRDR